MTSPIDNLFKEIFGFIPNKSGTAYELLTASVFKILSENLKVYHDERIRGIFSQTLYQIDVQLKKDNKNLVAEVKDYTYRSEKVGRPDIQKFAGALRELNTDGGMFFSATDFTEPAKKYAEASEKIIDKEIRLFHLRPSVDQDENGRIKKIVLSIHILEPLFEKAKMQPVITENGINKIEDMKNEGKLYVGQELNLLTEKIYDSKGNVLTTISDITSTHYDTRGENAVGSFRTPGGHIIIENELIEIHGITYDIPFSVEIHKVIVNSKGNAKLLIKDEKGNIDKIITDKQLEKIEFNDDGEILIKDQ